MSRNPFFHPLYRLRIMVRRADFFVGLVRYVWGRALSNRAELERTFAMWWFAAQHPVTQVRARRIVRGTARRYGLSAVSAALIFASIAAPKSMDSAGLPLIDYTARQFLGVLAPAAGWLVDVTNPGFGATPSLTIGQHFGINSAISTAAAQGGGIVVLPPTSAGTQYSVGAQILQASNVEVFMPPGVSLLWVGANSTAMVTSSTTATLIRANITGILDCNNRTGVIGYQPHSLQNSRVDLFIRNGTGAGSIGAQIYADVSTGFPAPLFQNVAFNDFTLWIDGTFQTAVSWRGFAAVAANTINRIRAMRCTRFTSLGLDMIESCDTNLCEHAFFLFGASNATGIIVNDLAPVNADHDAKGWQFGQIGFGSSPAQGFTGSTGITINWTTGTDFGHLFYDASAFPGGGTLINDVTGRGYIAKDMGQSPNVQKWNNTRLLLQSAIINDSVQAFANVAAITPDPQQGSLVLVDYNQAFTINAPTVYAGGGGPGGLAFTNHGARLTFRFRHDATANVYAITWNAAYKRAGGSFANTNANGALDSITFEYDTFTASWNEIARAINLS